jgi:NADH-quinone oxidoreductase subunit F
MMTGAMVLTGDFDRDDLFRLETYLERGGYAALRKALAELSPAQVIAEVKNASLRGRGGAGFPAGLKWSFVPQAADGPRYLCVNADEGEPGTFKDRYILAHDPHLLIEGIALTCYAVGIRTAYVYIRGEYENIARRFEGALEEARSRGFLGPSVLGSVFGLDIHVHRGAGAYICGEETALLESLEGKRGHPRLKPPFPAVVGLFGRPTVINNVETLANIPSIVLNGAAWFVEQGKPRDGGTRIFGVSGPVNRPGIFELPVGASLRELIFTHAGGLRSGKTLKAVVPGGLSAPVLRADEIDIPLSAEGVAAAGSMIGSGGVIVIDESTPMISVLAKVTRFYSHESCGQCTPCRIGTTWMHKIVRRIASGDGRPSDLDELIRLSENIKGRTLCPLGDAAALPILGIVRKFRAELEKGMR